MQQWHCWCACTRVGYPRPSTTAPRTPPSGMRGPQPAGCPCRSYLSRQSKIKAWIPVTFATKTTHLAARQYRRLPNLLVFVTYQGTASASHVPQRMLQTINPTLQHASTAACRISLSLSSMKASTWSRMNSRREMSPQSKLARVCSASRTSAPPCRSPGRLSRSGICCWMWEPRSKEEAGAYYRSWQGSAARATPAPHRSGHLGGASGQESVVDTTAHNKGRRGPWSRDMTASACSRPPSLPS